MEPTEAQVIPAQSGTAISDIVQQPSANIVADFSRAYKLAKVIATADIIPDKHARRLRNCRGYGGQNGRFAYDGDAEPLCGKGQALLERAGLQGSH